MGTWLENYKVFCYFCRTISFVPAQLPAPANSHVPQGGHKAAGSSGWWQGAPWPRPAGVGLGHPIALCEQQRESNAVPCVQAAGEQPGPAPAFWCPFNPPQHPPPAASLQLLSHVLTTLTRPRAEG